MEQLYFGTSPTANALKESKNSINGKHFRSDISKTAIEILSFPETQSISKNRLE